MSASTSTSLSFDVLIVGSGLAGLSAALLLASTHKVAILTKRAVREGSSGHLHGHGDHRPEQADGHGA